MKNQADGVPTRHPGITMHKIPVAGVGGLVFTIGLVVLALARPSDREMVSCWCRDSGCSSSRHSQTISEVAPADRGRTGPA